MSPEALIDRLHAEACSCVIEQGGTVRVFRQRGVADLFRLWQTEPDYLRGARVADKVVGRAAAALLVKGGVAYVHADVICRPARCLLQQAGVTLTYGVEVDHIVNRDRTGWCPLEMRCRPETSVEGMLVRITEFLASRNREVRPTAPASEPHEIP